MFLVTGGAGFIGSFAVDHLLAQGIPVRVLDDLSTGRGENLAGSAASLIHGDATDPATLRAAMSGCEAVIHLAARISVPDSCRDPHGYALANDAGTVAVFEAARQLGVRRVVYASTCAVYGSTPELPKRETDALVPESPYAASKAAAEMYAQAYTRTLGLGCVGLRFFNVYGPRQDPAGAYAAAIPKFIERAAAGEPLVVFGDGEQGRDFVHVRDVARAIALAATVPGAAGRVFNIGGGRMRTINEIARLIIAQTNGRSAVERRPARDGDVRFSLADISLAAGILGWRPVEDFDAGMAETVAWYLRNAG